MTAVLTGTGTATRADRSRRRAGVAASVPQPRLRAELTPDAAVHAHPVQQVLTNLLGNAVRHGAPDTQIHLVARLDRGTLVARTGSGRRDVA
jgi:signal transduction histidine kinase